ncbi:nuclear transport factor 2 family protein [Streptomyces sp. NPDC020951]|uniref:nuclear transport factor 2 family protein n=1 Tax=Streptomyces sp. NPDC020951 TaxID=3365104 RepID=UPI00379CCD35
MTEIDELRATVEQLAAQVRTLQDQVDIMQLVAQYGPAVDSGSGEAAAALWTADGVFDAIPHLRMEGRDDIVGMVHGTGHQSVIDNGCGHVLTVPHIVVDGDRATGRSHALHLRWDADVGRFWVFQVSANTWRWVRTARGWRIAERVNANLDGTPAPRAMLTPPAADGPPVETTATAHPSNRPRPAGG